MPGGEHGGLTNGTGNGKKPEEVCQQVFLLIVFRNWFIQVAVERGNDSASLSLAAVCWTGAGDGLGGGYVLGPLDPSLERSSAKWVFLKMGQKRGGLPGAGH